MTDFSRRAIMEGAGLAALAAAVPLKALAQGAPPADAAPLWDLSDIYPSDAAWEGERQAVLKLLPSLEAWKGKLGSSAATLKSALDAI